MIAIEEVAKISRQTLPLITVLTGDDVGQYEILRERFLKQLAFDRADLSCSYFDLSQDNYEAAELDLESLPFFADEKIVLIDAFADLTTDKKSYLDEKALKRFEAYLNNPVDTTRLVILAPGKLDGKRRLVKLLKRESLVLEATNLKESELKTYFQKEAHAQGLVFDSGAFESLLIKSNYDFAEIHKNLAFLKAYKNFGNISQADIAEAIPKTLQDNIFDLTQFVIASKVDEVTALVCDLRLQGEDDIKLIAVMLGQFRLFLQVKILSSQGRSEQQIVTDLSTYLGRKVNPYQIRFAMRDSRSLSLDFLKKVVVDLITCDYQIKTGVYDKDYLFDLTLLKIMAKSH